MILRSSFRNQTAHGLFWKPADLIVLKNISGLKRNHINSRPEISTFRLTLLFRDGWFIFIKSYISRRFVLWAVKSLQFRSSSTAAAAGVWPDCIVERCLHLTAVCLLTHCVTNIIIPPKYGWTHFPVLHKFFRRRKSPCSSSHTHADSCRFPRLTAG